MVCAGEDCVGIFFEIADRMWDVLRKALFVCKGDVSTFQAVNSAWHIDMPAKKDIVNLPRPKLEYDALHRLVLVTVHDLYDIICVLLQNSFFGREYVVIVDTSGDFVEDAQTFIVIQQKLRKDLLTGRSRETLDDLVTDVNLTIGGIAVEAHVNNGCRHENENWGSLESEKGR